jgi:membrane-associated phospholipid phosphatase
MTVRTSWLKRHALELLFLFFGVLAPLCLFENLAQTVIGHQVFSFDDPILLFFHAHASATLDSVMLLFSRLGSIAVMLPFNTLIFIFLLYRRKHADALFWCFAVGGAAALNVASKLCFTRVRPNLWISIQPETTFSFPSGHAMESMAVVAALTVLLWRTRWAIPMLLAGTCFVLLVGMSRNYLGVHYPSDILAGWTVSLAWVTGLSLIFKRRRALRADQEAVAGPLI